MRRLRSSGPLACLAIGCLSACASLAGLGDLSPGSGADGGADGAGVSPTGDDGPVTEHASVPDATGGGGETGNATGSDASGPTESDSRGPAPDGP